MNITASIYKEIEDREIEILATGTYSPPSRGKRDRYGAQMEPDEPDSIEDVFATVDGEGYKLDSEENARSMGALWEAVSDSLDNE